MEQERPTSEKPGHPPAQASLHEVRTAENSAAFLLPKLQSMKESNPHLKLLDVGAGSGTISVSFSKLIPDGHVIGVDVNANILPRAQAVAEEAGVQNIEFQQGSIYSLPFPDETFDLTFCHQVLIHIGNPWDALREMLRVTKRGGIVAAREGDYETECVWPESSELLKFHKLMAGLMSAGGGTPTAGRQLVSWALKAGVERSQVTLSFSTTSYQTPSERTTLSEGLCDQLRGGARLREKAVKFGLGTEIDFEEMIQAWKEWAKSDDASLAMLHGEILVQK
ncbi:putative coq5 family methyltransferase protein [Phaeoacremonium minimum UCRPA7]|uniref:Putative coq5 family methyltransferase protein n=1 Tax=Phaeoacremonium minimum (strain UCR-PA7) TaxID=1286976 RepID=R8BP57_PHAM7|nr:putative coq5 family methyltransferase protein [Phaeoacremonium minimum UCRPA7]EOO01188.1 putative coq5 family methyltransferase protein [Phaeoacremonium minimum UCRPA7]